MPDNLNLIPERGPNVWDKPRQSAGEGLHTGAAVGGAVMLAAGAAAAIVGGRMLYRAVRATRGRMETGPSPATLERDIVEEESAESFPASDPPSWMASEGATLDARRRRAD